MGGSPCLLSRLWFGESTGRYGPPAQWVHPPIRLKQGFDFCASCGRVAGGGWRLVRGAGGRRAVGVGEGSIGTPSEPRSRLINPHALHGSSKVEHSVQPIWVAADPASPGMIHPAHTFGFVPDDDTMEIAMNLEESAFPTHREVAARLGVLMAVTNQRGFEVFTKHGGRPPLPPFRHPDIRIEVLARLCFVADNYRSSFLLRVGEPCWLGRVLGGLGGDRRVCGCAVDGWAGNVRGRVGQMGGMVVAVGMLDEEGRGGVCVALGLCGLCRWGRAWSCLCLPCVPVLSHVRV